MKLAMVEKGYINLLNSGNSGDTTLNSGNSGKVKGALYVFSY